MTEKVSILASSLSFLGHVFCFKSYILSLVSQISYLKSQILKKELNQKLI
jgi:hypothetical protein